MEENKNINNANENENQNDNNQVPQEPKKENKILGFAKRNVKTVVAFALGFAAKTALDALFGGSGSSSAAAEIPDVTTVTDGGVTTTNF